MCVGECVVSIRISLSPFCAIVCRYVRSITWQQINPQTKNKKYRKKKFLEKSHTEKQHCSYGDDDDNGDGSTKTKY